MTIFKGPTTCLLPSPETFREPPSRTWAFLAADGLARLASNDHVLLAADPESRRRKGSRIVESLHDGGDLVLGNLREIGAGRPETAVLTQDRGVGQLPTAGQRRQQVVVNVRLNGVEKRKGPWRLVPRESLA